ncbi:Calpain-9 [Hypsizygus marmoreus]|uniref:Calpain-9 n=1 Tax=Hypsizygus marmoreus TaxID=39966 RepID=A0A369J1Y1_HYPMA|nr:Calpain-9 [Hypsizygus marmoreus]
MIGAPRSFRYIHERQKVENRRFVSYRGICVQIRIVLFEDYTGAYLMRQRKLVGPLPMALDSQVHPFLDEGFSERQKSIFGNVSAQRRYKIISKMANKKQKKARRAQQDTASDTPLSSQASFPQEDKLGGLLVTNELEKALEECQKNVARISRDCRQKNRKFRDIEFDLETDFQRCLHGLSQPCYSPSDVQRVTQIFDMPSFFIDGADSNDIAQGAIGDCWFVSALATMASAKGLVEKFCVARDEQVGVYGFIFFRDTAWVVVIIDDLLFTSIPKFEELRIEERALYHDDKDTYNQSARKHGNSLYFARSGTNGETWVPLIEKAYAKLHGNYAALHGGFTGEAIEDLTGGVTSFIHTKDILDPDNFWNHELLLIAKRDRLFGCSFKTLNFLRSGDASVTVNGLVGGHAYSVLKAVEYNGKRFVVLRNPWGQSEWTGPWSDGSKQWSREWLSALDVLDHEFGNDGQFVMEYKDFLANWEQIDRTLLFDSSWAMSSQWLKVTPRSYPSAWSFGDVSFTISLPAASPIVIVLSKLDDRYFKPISGSSTWSFDFIVYRKGEIEPVTSSTGSSFSRRSVNAEISLEAGDYVVHVRLDYEPLGPSPNTSSERTRSRIQTEKAKSESIASNFNKEVNAEYLPIPLEVLAGQDLSELETKAAAATKVLSPDQTVTKASSPAQANEKEKGEEHSDSGSSANDDGKEHVVKTPSPSKDNREEDGWESESNAGGDGKVKNDEKDPANISKGWPVDVLTYEDDDDEEEEVIFLGLRVYSKKNAPAVVGGQLRHGAATSFAGLALTGL